VPEDVGGSQDPDGSDHGADDAFADVVFDEAFVRSAALHEPSAQERILAAVEARLEREATGAGRAYRRPDEGSEPVDDSLPEELRPSPVGDDDILDWRLGAVRRSPFGGPSRRRRRPGGRQPQALVRWHRPVAWFLAVVMGLGVVAVSVAAVYRSAGGVGTTSPGRPDTGSFGTPAVDPSQQPVVTVPSATRSDAASIAPSSVPGG
jgi:hypothetical protein